MPRLDSTVEGELSDFSDTQIADLVLERVWANEPIGGPRALLLEQAIDRLRRTGREQLTDDDLLAAYQAAQ